MNERIRQLYYECQDESQSTESCYQKFAELIVAECIGVVNKTDPPGYEDYPDYRDQIEKSFRIECVTEIKKHFGVEE